MPFLSRLTFVVAMLAAPLTDASCGSAGCTLMTDRFAQTAGTSHTGWSADVRIETVTQDRLRSGTSTLEPDEVDEHELEGHTKNLNTVATLEYAFGPSWSAVVRIPIVHREHEHTLFDEDTHERLGAERWRFMEPADVQALVRRQWTTSSGRFVYAAFGGLELPAGATDIDNADGDEAERALQPGSGTTDLVAGIAGRWLFGASDALIGQVSVVRAFGGDADFEPGQRSDATLGWSHAFSRRIGSVLQINYRHRARDDGDEAEPSDSGAELVDVSPGITFGFAAVTVYAYWQIPLYQRVDGVQLVPERALALGFTWDF